MNQYPTTVGIAASSTIPGGQGCQIRTIAPMTQNVTITTVRMVATLGEVTH